MVILRLSKPKKFGTSDIIKSEGLTIDIKLKLKKKKQDRKGRKAKPGKISLKKLFSTKQFKKKLRLLRGVRI